MTAAWSRRGRAWVFPQSDVNTDVVMQRSGYQLPPAQQRDLVLASLRPGWGRRVQEGDLLVAGRGFGTGSSRPVITLLRSIGIVGIAAVSVGEIFFRNAVSCAVPVLQCPDVLDVVADGDTIELDVSTGVLRNETTGRTAMGTVLPSLLLDTLAAGGTFAQLRAGGFL